MRQGGTLSVMHFNIYSKDIIQEELAEETKIGIRVNENIMTDIQYLLQNL